MRIVDRKKELIINAGGKNMSPANIENKVKAACPLVGSVVAIGDRRPYNTALIVLDPVAAAGFAAANGIDATTPAELVREDALLREVAAGVARANESLSRVEQIKRHTLLPEEWQPGGDELTPTMKLKRKPIAEKYAAQIDAMYERDEPAPQSVEDARVGGRSAGPFGRRQPPPGEQRHHGRGGGEHREREPDLRRRAGQQSPAGLDHGRDRVQLRDRVHPPGDER